jgi:hypothetical protein
MLRSRSSRNAHALGESLRLPGASDEIGAAKLRKKGVRQAQSRPFNEISRSRH